MTKMLNAENVLASSGLSAAADSTGAGAGAAYNLTADRILYQHAVSQCQEAALDELLGSPGGCVQVCSTRFGGKFKSLVLNGRDSFQLFVGVFGTCLVWYLLVLPSEAHNAANMISMRPIDGNTSYHSRESFPLSS